MEKSENSRKFHYEKWYVTNPLKINNMLLVQIGRTHCAENYFIEEHPHLNWFEITYIFDGEGAVITNGVSTPVKSGDLYLSFPGDTHAIRSDKHNPLKFNFLSLWTEDEEILEELEKIMLVNMDSDKRTFSDKNIENLVDSSISEVILNDKFSQEMLSFSLNQIIRYIIRDFSLDGKNAKLNFTTSEELCYQMMNYINTHIYVMNGLDTLAKYFGYSYGYLSEIFRKTTGEKLIDYYTMRRLESAALLLKENELNSVQIAELLGYSSIYSFSRAFKNYFGISPRDYKNQLKTTQST